MAITIHFLNVGHGDCTIVDFEDNKRIAMIDINQVQSLDGDTEKEFIDILVKGYRYQPVVPLLYSLGLKDFSPETRRLAEVIANYSKRLTDPVAFFKSRYPGRSIFRFIATHPDMDHLSGLSKLCGEERVGIVNLWDTNHKKTFSKDEFKDSPYDYRDWETYQALRSGRNLTVLRLYRGASDQYYRDDGIYILAPTKELEEAAGEEDHWNHISYVLMIIHGHSRIVLGGDATEKVWKDIYLVYRDEQLKATLLKASHHGRDTGYYAPAVKAMNPDYTIVSVGKKPENDASNKYRQHTNKKVLSTRYHGTITARCWLDGSTWLYDASGERIDEEIEGAIQQQYR